MSESDKYDDQVERLLPCSKGGDEPWHHQSGCAADCRPAVAARLRTDGLEIERLSADQHDDNCDSRDAMIQDKPCNCYLLYKAERDQLRVEIERLKARLIRPIRVSSTCVYLNNGEKVVVVRGENGRGPTLQVIPQDIIKLAELEKKP